MFRKNFHRGITAVVFAAALTVAGAQPAAAEGFGWRQAWDWLAGFWGFSLQVSSPVFDSSDAGPEIDPNGRPNAGPEIDPNGSTVQGDCGAEIDPNGRTCPRPSAGGEIDPNG